MTKKEATKKPAPKKPAKKVTEATDMLSVSDVAREAGIDPKAVRAALRDAGRKPKDGRWPKVERGSDAHTALTLFLEGNSDGVNSAPKK